MHQMYSNKTWLRLSIALAMVCLVSVSVRHGAPPASSATTPTTPTTALSIVEYGRVSNDAQHAPTATFRLCQGWNPAAPFDVPAVDCIQGGNCELGWEAMGPVGFGQHAQGEYVANPRLAHVPEYRLRVDDELDFVYRLTRVETTRPYELNVGDEVRIESVADKGLERTLVVQPDGTITLPLLGQVRVTHQTVDQVREHMDELYQKFYKVPAITVTPIKVNTRLEDLRATVDRRAGLGGQAIHSRVTPEGTLGLPAIGSVPAQGLNLDELKREIDERYAADVEGIEVTPILTLRAQRGCFVLGEVSRPGRYVLEGPTTVMQAIALAGGWNVGANVNQVVIFRRAEDWRLMATMLELRPALLGHQPCPADEIWVADADLIIIPKSKILVVDNFIDLVFTRGLYRVFPFSTSLSFTNLTTLR